MKTESNEEFKVVASLIKMFSQHVTVGFQIYSTMIGLKVAYWGKYQ